MARATARREKKLLRNGCVLPGSSLRILSHALIRRGLAPSLLGRCSFWRVDQLDSCGRRYQRASSVARADSRLVGDLLSLPSCTIERGLAMTPKSWISWLSAGLIALALIVAPPASIVHAVGDAHKV